MTFVLVFVILVLDQLTKFIAQKTLLVNQSIPVIKGIFHLTLIYNRGGAFGIFKGQAILFISMGIVASIFILLNLKKVKHKRISLYSLSLGFILAGALGNLLDRLFLGYVVDFLDFRIWPVFNLADSSITIGALLLGWDILIRKKKN
ncbi:MAG: signal peptidase II [Candidatus Omnitrophica bacterium]|nr:signal peptidase II [Candidatus Omnitrophota bacterium]